MLHIKHIYRNKLFNYILKIIGTAWIYNSENTGKTIPSAAQNVFRTVCINKTNAVLNSNGIQLRTVMTGYNRIFSEISGYFSANVMLIWLVVHGGLKWFDSCSLSQKSGFCLLVVYDDFVLVNSSWTVIKNVVCSQSSFYFINELAFVCGFACEFFKIILREFNWY